MYSFLEDLTENGRGGFLVTVENPNIHNYPDQIELEDTIYQKIVFPMYYASSSHFGIEYVPLKEVI